MTQIKIDAELLISLVENRPIVWDKTSKHYKDKLLRTVAWREICINLKGDFEEMEKKERQNYAKAVVKKWNQLRDSWSRTLNVTKSTKKSGSGSVRTKKYCYHNQMLFLKKIINPAETHDSANSTEINKNNSNTEDGDLENTMNQNKEHELSVAHENTDQENPSSTKRSKKQDVARQKLSAMDLKMISFIDNQMNTKDNSQNEDRNLSFFNGLIPTLGLLNDDQVLEFQAGVINLLQNRKRRNNYSYQSPPQGYFTSQYPVHVSPNASSQSFSPPAHAQGRGRPRKPVKMTEEESPKEEEPEIKHEIEDYFSEHEDDLEEALNRKRQHETDPLEDTGKRVKTESQENIEIQEPQVHLKQQQSSLVYNSEIQKPSAVDIYPQPKSKLTVEINKANHNDFPVDFMKSVLSSQNEILTVLKSQVLLQDPDPDLLTFLRLIGAKLSRFSKVKREEMQNSIIDFIDKRK